MIRDLRSDARELLAYYNLEQYPETHLFYGPQFTEIYSGQDENEPFVDDKKNYERDEEKGEYIIINDWEKSKQNYNHEHASILPRMWSSEHAENYMIGNNANHRFLSEICERYALSIHGVALSLASAFCSLSYPILS